MINFHSEDIKFALKNKRRLKQWIASTIEKKKCKIVELNFIFCSDDYLVTINKQYLNHNTYTDIITFDYSKDNSDKFPISKGVRGIRGDVFISIDRVKENANKFSKSFEEELHRIIIHGVLHLLGYKDKTKSAKEEMTKKENDCLKELETIHKMSL